MRKIILLAILAFCFGCKKSGPKLSGKENGLKKTIQSQEEEKPNEEPQIIWSSDYVRIFGERSIDSTKIHYTTVKFEPFISFGDFEVIKIYSGVKAKLNYQSNNIAKEYKTVITQGYQETGLNFAGHYSLISWMCGAPCQHFALVDLIDGKVYDGVFAQQGYDYRNNSRLLIVNPPDSSGFYVDVTYAHPELWIWDENKKIFEQKLP